MSITIPPLSVPPAIVASICDTVIKLSSNACPIANLTANGCCIGDAALGAIKLYKECVTWDSIVFLILGLALAFAGYKFWKIACGLMGLVVSYWWIYPILIQHSGLTDGPCWGIAIAIGVVLAIGLWYFADPIGIFCMGFMLGVLLGGMLLSLLCLIPDVQTWINEKAWFPKVILVVCGLGHAIYSLWHKMETVVQATSFIGAYLMFCGIDRLLGNGQLQMVAERYLFNFSSNNSLTVCKCTNYMFIGAIVLSILCGCFQGALMRGDQSRKKQDEAFDEPLDGSSRRGLPPSKSKKNVQMRDRDHSTAVA